MAENKGPAEDVPAFHQFQKLPTEVRLAIWECLWLPRAIQPVLHLSDPDDETGWMFLSPIGSELRELGSRISALPGAHMRESGLGANPVTLRVCREARHITLMHFDFLEVPDDEPDIGGSRVYFDPRRDVLWLSHEFVEWEEHWTLLNANYGPDSINTGNSGADQGVLALFTTTVLVEEEIELRGGEEEWVDNRIAAASIFPGLKNAVVLFESHRFQPDVNLGNVYGEVLEKTGWQVEYWDYDYKSHKRSIPGKEE